jgi:cytosine/uracil/thiamine/allantoin permease
VEPQRRQWRDWNFVGFWIADSFNIVSQDFSALSLELCPSAPSGQG